MIGQSIAHYRITAKLGEGGMGEVYRATDTKLSREVAIKVLPAAVSADPDRLARFEREARTLAALNHPNIAAVYGVEHAALVMELVEGPTLQDRLSSGAIPIAEAIQLARQIAEALEAAHEKGIIHRDLKPANIKVTPDGAVKLLDFGLAKAIETQHGDSSISPANSPTLTQHMSQAGIILGTAAYMSPEQARGGTVDKRADIWSFGVVVYEMLTARRLFEGETISDILAGVLKSDIDLTKLPTATPEWLRRLLTRCLERDKKKRLHDIGDAFWEDSVAPPLPVVRATPRWMPALVVVTALLAAAGGWFLRPMRSSQLPLRMLSIETEPLSPTEGPIRFAIAPNGRHVAYIAQEKLWIRDLDRPEPRALGGTDQAESPFFSPDSATIAFAVGQELKKVPLMGGMPSVLTRFAGFFRGGTWSSDLQTIVFATTAALFEVPASGGEPKTLLERKSTARTDTTPGSAFYSPQFLPSSSSDRLLAVGRGTRSNQTLQIVNLTTGKVQSLRKGAYPVYAASGHLLYRTDGRAPGLWAWPFSSRRGEPEGEPVSLLNMAFDFSAGADGSLIWTEVEGTYDMVLTWRDRAGRKLGDFGSPQQRMAGVSISPDGARAAYSAAERANTDIWIQDLSRGARTRFTFDPGIDLSAGWNPVSSELAFSTQRGGPSSIQVQPLDRPGETTTVSSLGDPGVPYSWSPDGKILLFGRQDTNTGWDIWFSRRNPDGSFAPPEKYLQTPFVERGGVFSPDGTMVAYETNANGRFDIYVQSFPTPSRQRQISADGGACAVWSRDGAQLFFLNGDALYSAAFNRATRDFASAVKEFGVAGLRRVSGLQTTCPYAIHPDGKRFLFAEPVNPAAVKPPTIQYIQNWPALLRRPLPPPPPELQP